jgi:predicted nucleotidyltransferase
MVSEELIQQVAQRLHEAAPDATIILFGSHARGDAREHSDLDFLVVEPVVTGQRAEMVRLGRAIRDLRITTDILVTTPQDFQEWSEEPGHVYRRAAREGRVLYAAGQVRPGSDGQGCGG